MQNDLSSMGKKVMGIMVKMVQGTTITRWNKMEKPMRCAGIFYQAKRPPILRLEEKQQRK